MTASFDQAASGSSPAANRKMRITDLKRRKSSRWTATRAVIVFCQGDKFRRGSRPGIANQNASTTQVCGKDGKLCIPSRARNRSTAWFRPTAWVAMGSSMDRSHLGYRQERAAAGGDMPAHQKGLGDLVFTPDKKRS
jgi:hypothetical protein